MHLYYILRKFRIIVSILILYYMASISTLRNCGKCFSSMWCYCTSAIFPTHNKGLCCLLTFNQRIHYIFCHVGSSTAEAQCKIMSLPVNHHMQYTISSVKFIIIYLRQFTVLKNSKKLLRFRKLQRVKITIPSRPYGV